MACWAPTTMGRQRLTTRKKVKRFIVLLFSLGFMTEIVFFFFSTKLQLLYDLLRIISLMLASFRSISRPAIKKEKKVC
jgi:hypothetical protein